MTDDKVMISRYQTVSELRLNDVVTIISMNDVLNVVNNYKIKEANEKVEQMKAITDQHRASADKQRQESRMTGYGADMAEMDVLRNRQYLDNLK